MVWSLKKHAYQVYSRNPLVAVAIELRFHPILKIGSGQVIPDYQDKIRAYFPRYQEGTVQVVNLNAPTNVEIKEEKQYQFLDDETKTQLVLGADKILLTCNNHVDRVKTLGKFNQALTELKSICGEIMPIRIGLRYINYIDLNKITSDLGKSLKWDDLVKGDFLKIPAELADLEDTSYMMELSSPMNRGGLTLRYGLLRESPDSNMHFRFDSDRYLADKFDIDDTIRILNEFVEDIYCLFSEMRGESLENWMSSK